MPVNNDAKHSRDKRTRMMARKGINIRPPKQPPEAPRPGPGNVAFGYGRVSTAKQDISIDAQKKQSEDYFTYRLQPQGLTWGGFYSDSAVSGEKKFKERPAGGTLNQRLRRGDHIVISKLDRAFRRAMDGMTMIDYWRSIGVTVHFLDINVDCSTLMGQMLLTIYGYFAQMERERIAERTRQALRHIRATGHWLGGYSARVFGAKVPTGLRLIKPGHHKNARRLEWQEDEITLLRDIYDLKEQTGWPCEYIAKKLNELGITKPRSEGPWTLSSVSTKMKLYRKYLESNDLPDYARPGKLSYTRMMQDTPSSVTPLPGTEAAPSSCTSPQSATQLP